jgi:hypothetical protein
VNKQFVYGIFESNESLEKTIDILKNVNFKKSNIVTIKDERFKTLREKCLIIGACSLIGIILGQFIGIQIFVGLTLGLILGLSISYFDNIRLKKKDYKSYRNCLKNGGLIISIQVKNYQFEMLAKEILRINGAIDIATSSEKYLSNDFAYYNQANTSQNMEGITYYNRTYENQYYDDLLYFDQTISETDK